MAKSKAAKISNVSESRKAGLSQAGNAPKGGKTPGLVHSDASKPIKAPPNMKI